MTSQVLAGLLLRQPFQPFRFVFADNTEVSVRRAEQVKHKPGDQAEHERAVADIVRRNTTDQIWQRCAIRCEGGA